MENHEVARIESLASNHDELRRLWEEHLLLEKQLEALNSHAHLSPNEQASRNQLKKRKLVGRDRIARILTELDA